MAKTNSSHWIPIDTAAASGGDGGANDPVQLLIIAAAGCSAIDITDFLHKSRKSFRDFVLHIEAVRFPTPPKIIRSLKYHLQLTGADIEDDLIKRAFQLSLTKYCSVSLSLDRSVTFHARATLNDREIPEWEIARDAALFSRPWPAEPPTP